VYPDLRMAHYLNADRIPDIATLIISVARIVQCVRFERLLSPYDSPTKRLAETFTHRCNIAEPMATQRM
jgi:hypothetical protein